MLPLLTLMVKLCLLGHVSGFLICMPPDYSSYTEECQLLDSLVTHNFTDGATLTFLPGVHTLTGSIWIHDVSDVEIAGVTDTGVSIECTGSAGMIFQHVTNVIIENISFVSCGQSLPCSLQRDGETAQAAIAFGEVTDLQLSSVSVSHSHGYGILGHCVYGNFTISESSFVFNNGCEHYLGGNAAIEYTNCSKSISKSLHISFSKFLYGDYSGFMYTNYSNTLATGLALILSQSNTTVMITDVVMKGNVNRHHQHGLGGNLFLHFYNETNSTSNSVTIRNSRFEGGVSYTGGGISVSFHTDPNAAGTDGCKNHLVIQNTNISDNSADIGGGMYINFVLKHLKEFDCPRDMLMVEDCTFDQNKVIAERTKLTKNLQGRGVAVHINYIFSNHRLANVHQTFKHFVVTFSNCNFTRSQQDGLISEYLEIEGISFMNNNGHVTIRDSTFANNEFTAISGYRSRLEFSGDILLENNTGISGGGLRLCESSYAFISSKTSIRFINNRATISGGAMYIEEGCPFSIQFCAIQFTNINNCAADSEIVMLNNTANFSGEHIYGGSFDQCRMTNCDSRKLFDSVFTILPNSTSSSQHLSAISSRPERVCFCLGGRLECELEEMHHHDRIFPGEVVEFQAAIVGQYNGTVPGTILVQAHKYEQIEPATKQCANVRVPVKYDEGSGNNASAVVVLRVASHFIDGTSTYVSLSQSVEFHVSVKGCPLGFHSNYTTGMCDCADKLKENKVQCDIGSQTVTRSSPSWIGYNKDNEDYGLIYHEVCPYDYCSDSEVDILSDENDFHQDLQCASNRSGLLCSKCQHGLSESLGSSECLNCKTGYGLALTVIGIALAGILLVLALALLNITYTDGMLSGLLFYANIINLNSSVFLPAQQIHDAVRLLISWQSLNHGLSSCFYDGMDSYVKGWLGFLFPVYLFMIIAVIIFLCRKFKKIAYIFGGNVVKVLATLLLLSYSKLIDAVVTVLSCTILHYPSHSKLVWLSDATLGFFVGRHLPLALVAVVFGLLILTYTLVLLFVQPLQRYSHLCCFSWVARLKPLIDAYTSPHVIKDNCRYWEGLLLSLRLVLAMIFAVNIRNTSSANLAAIIGICVLLLTIAWSVGGVYRQRHLNILNSFCILHLAVFALAVSYNTGPLSSTLYFRCVAYISYCLQILTLVAVVAYCVFLRVKTLRMLYKRSHDQNQQDGDFNQANHEDVMYLHQWF